MKFTIVRISIPWKSENPTNQSFGLFFFPLENDLLNIFISIPPGEGHLGFWNNHNCFYTGWLLNRFSFARYFKFLYIFMFSSIYMISYNKTTIEVKCFLWLFHNIRLFVFHTVRFYVSIFDIPGMYFSNKSEIWDLASWFSKLVSGQNWIQIQDCPIQSLCLHPTGSCFKYIKCFLNSFSFVSLQHLF